MKVVFGTLGSVPAIVLVQGSGIDVDPSKTVSLRGATQAVGMCADSSNSG